MGVLNRKKAGAAGPGGPGEEFFNAAEASQLNTLLRGKSGPAASEGDGGGSELNAQGAAAGAEAQVSDGGRPKRSTAGAKGREAAEAAAAEAKASPRATRATRSGGAAAAAKSSPKASAKASPPRPSPARSTRSRPAASGGVPALGAEELMGGKLQLPTLSQGMTQMSDSYLQDLSIDSGGNPNFFKDGAVDGGDTHTVSMGPPPSRGWGGSLGAALMTRSHGGGSQGGGGNAASARSGGSSGGASPGYFNNNELSELFSIVRGKNVFGKKAAAGATRMRGENLGLPSAGPGGAPDAMMRALPPIRTKSLDASQHASAIGGVESPRSAGIQLPGSAGRLVTGLTPHGMLVGTGLTPTGLTPGSLAGFPGMDHFSMNLPEGAHDGLMPGMPGWPVANAAEDKNGDLPGVDAGGKKRKASTHSGGGSKAKASKSGGRATSSKNSKGTNRSKSKGGSDDDDDDIPLSGLVRHTMGSGGAAAAAEAAAKKLGLPLPSQTVSTHTTNDTEGDDTEDGSKGGKSRSRSWLPSEDALVRTLVAQHGPRKWTLIATRLKTKTQKQVYARWRDYLQPGLTTKPWSKEEQAKLVELQAHVGNQWAVLARLMPGRSPNAIKNRFHATKRKLERHNKRDGSNLNPDAGGGEVVSAPKQAGAAEAEAGKAKGGTKTKPAQAMSHETYSKEEQMAVEGLLLADTPTSLMAARERRSADAHFDRANAELDIQDRLGMEANKAARAAQARKR